MKTAYLGISKSNRVNFDLEIAAIKDCLKDRHINLMVFVDKYNFELGQEKEMMRIAFDEINKSDLVIVELTKKAIGVGVEVGYAVAKNKPIIYLKRKEANYSTTVGGCTDYLIEYTDENQLKIKLNKILESLN